MNTSLRVVPDVLLATGTNGKSGYSRVIGCELLPPDDTRDTRTIPVVCEMHALIVKTENGGKRYYGVNRGYISARLRMVIEPHSPRFEELAAWPMPHVDELI